MSGPPPKLSNGGVPVVTCATAALRRKVIAITCFQACWPFSISRPPACRYPKLISLLDCEESVRQPRVEGYGCNRSIDGQSAVNKFLNSKGHLDADYRL